MSDEMLRVGAGGASANIEIPGLNADGSKWGAVDMSGRDITALIYDGVGFYSENIFTIANLLPQAGDGDLYNAEWGLMDINGKIILPQEYSYIKRLEGDLALLNIGGKWVHNLYNADGYGLFCSRHSSLSYGMPALRSCKSTPCFPRSRLLPVICVRVGCGIGF